MKKKKEQKILTLIIILAIIALTVLIWSIIYDAEIKRNKIAVENIKIPEVKAKEEVVEPVEEEKTVTSEEVTNEYIGEEEKEDFKEEIIIQNKDEKAIELAKKEWWEDDTVTFNIEKKNGAKYYIAVKKDAMVVEWYEVDTESWKISEY